MRIVPSNAALAYLMLVVIGVTFNLAGVLTLEIAREFSVETYEVGYSFSLFTGGYSVAVLCSGWLLRRFPLRGLGLAASFFAVAGAGGITVSAFPMPFGIVMLLLGAGEGLFCALAYHIIVNSFATEVRTAKLNLLNFFFSFGAIVSPLYAGGMLECGFSWKLVYRSVAILALFLTAGMIAADLRLGRRNESEAGGVDRRWNMGIYLMALALFLYVISEMIFSYWIVIYLKDVRDWEAAAGGTVLSLFWVFMAVGRLISGLGWFSMPVHRQILAFAGAAFLSLVGLLCSEARWAIYGLTATMGFGYSILYATVLSYGTLLAARPSARLMTFFITCGSLGNIASLVVSSFLKQHFEVAVCLWTGAFLMAAVAGLTFAAKILNRSSAAV